MNNTKAKIIARIQQLGIKELQSLKDLNELRGDYLNLHCKLPNGEIGKILDDNKTYFANQAELSGTDKCYGIAADEKQIAIYRYGCNGIDAELIAWLAL